MNLDLAGKALAITGGIGFRRILEALAEGLVEWTRLASGEEPRGRKDQDLALGARHRLNAMPAASLETLGEFPVGRFGL